MYLVKKLQVEVDSEWTVQPMLFKGQLYVCKYKMEYYSVKKKGNPVICDNMDEPGKHYSKGNKSEREWKIVNDPLICGILKSQTYSNRE